MNSHRMSSRSMRSGAAFLLLVVMVLLVVVGATQTLVRNELTTRRSEADRLRVRSMSSAIDAVQQIGGDAASPISLPVDVSRAEFIEVTVNQDKSFIMARWIKGDQVVDQMRRALNQKAESTE